MSHRFGDGEKIAAFVKLYHTWHLIGPAQGTVGRIKPFMTQHRICRFAEIRLPCMSVVIAPEHCGTRMAAGYLRTALREIDLYAAAAAQGERRFPVRAAVYESLLAPCTPVVSAAPQ